MKKVTLTKYCLKDEGPMSVSPTSFESKFEAYVEKKVRKIIDNPDNYPFIDVIVEE